MHEDHHLVDKAGAQELPDDLPASDKVPSPDKVLGYVIGTPNKLTYTKDMYRYYRELEKSTPRVRIFTAPERSEEGREQMLVVLDLRCLLFQCIRSASEQKETKLTEMKSHWQAMPQPAVRIKRLLTGIGGQII